MSEWIRVEDRLPSLIEATYSAIPFLVMLEEERTPEIGYFYIGWYYPWSRRGTRKVTPAAQSVI